MPMLRGTAHWAKILGDPKPAYGDTHNEWSVDVSIDEATVKQLTEQGVAHKIRNKDDHRGNFVTFRRKELKANGDPAARIAVVGPDRKPWDQTVLLGNGTIVNVKYVINEGDLPKPWKRPDILALQVAELVPYGDGEDFPEYETDENGAENWG